jgi:hypothetical protein
VFKAETFDVGSAYHGIYDYSGKWPSGFCLLLSVSHIEGHTDGMGIPPTTYSGVF